MLCSTCVLPFLALYMLLEETTSAVLPGGLRVKKEVNWPEQGTFPHPHDGSDQGDLSVGDAGETDRRSPHSETFLAPPEHVSLQSERLSQNLFHRRGNGKRRKVAPLDSISSFKASSLRNRKDKPDIYSEEHRE
ncbi:uncharacterized protein AB9W97_008755 isoform 1-T1 [Spinachia spinachia]